ncbi:unnamed protein product [Sphagnum balticum]
MGTGTMVQETSITGKDARANQGGDTVPDQDREAVNDVFTSDFDDDSDTSEYYDSEFNRLKQIDSKDEFVDAEFEELVSSEGPQEMQRLMLQEQANGIMTEEIADGDDYADWIRWVSDEEKSRQTMHESTHDVPTPLLLQQHCPENDSAIPMLLQTVQTCVGDHQLYMLDVTSGEDLSEELMPGEEAVSTGDEHVQHEEARMVLKRRRPQYFNKQQQLDLVLAAQELSEFGDPELSPTGPDDEEDHGVKSSCVDIWEDTGCLTLLKEGHEMHLVNFVLSKQSKDIAGLAMCVCECQ